MVTWIGADWDSEKCVVAYSDGQAVKRAKVKRHPRDVELFVQQFDGCVVGIESGDNLWPKLWRHAGAVVHVFDGKKARNYSESLCSSGARDDRRSAEDILEMVQSKPHRHNSNVEPGGVLAAFERLLRIQEDARKDVTRHKNRLTSLLRQVHPALAYDPPSLDKSGPTSSEGCSNTSGLARTDPRRERCGSQELIQEETSPNRTAPR